MEEPYIEDLASHNDPESCVCSRRLKGQIVDLDKSIRQKPKGSPFVKIKRFDPKKTQHYKATCLLTYKPEFP